MPGGCRSRSGPCVKWRGLLAHRIPTLGERLKRHGIRANSRRYESPALTGIRTRELSSSGHSGRGSSMRSTWIALGVCAGAFVGFMWGTAKPTQAAMVLGSVKRVCRSSSQQLEEELSSAVYGFPLVDMLQGARQGGILQVQSNVTSSGAASGGDCREQDTSKRHRSGGDSCFDCRRQLWRVGAREKGAGKEAINMQLIEG